MKKNIAILLPYKEKYNLNKAGAASIWVKDYLSISKLNNQTLVFGNLEKQDKPLTKNFVNIDITRKSTDILLEVSTLDHPGLLSKICESLDSCDLMVKDAKISTLGEEANDIFVLVPANKKDFLDNDMSNIKDIIKDKISELYIN